MPTKPSKVLETFDNPNPERDYLIEITMPEFTCLCPKTGQPDFATLYLEYVADKKCVELKALKSYIWSFRNEGAFHEAVTNAILNDLVAATAPRYMRLRAEFFVRGGIYTSVTAEHRKSDWRGTPPRGGDKVEPADAHLASEAAPTVTAARAEVSTTAQSSQRADTAVVGSTPAPNTASGRKGGSPRFPMLQRARTPAVAPAPASALAAEASNAQTPTDTDACFVGIDIGTSACRAIAIDRRGNTLGEASVPIPVPTNKDGHVTQDAQVWWKALNACLHALHTEVPAARVRALTVAGTSGTVLLCDKKGAPLAPALMYGDARAQAQAERIATVADRASGAHGASSALAKLLWLGEKSFEKKAAHCLHQADWLLGKLSGHWGVSDWNNALKLGYDAQRGAWPAWMSDLPFDSALLPKVHAPGTAIGAVAKEVAQTFGYNADTQVLVGTTDGVASFIAAGASDAGHAVTSLGTTLVLKLISDKPVFSPDHGVYSHRFGDRWLVGGASNSGGAALALYFTPEQIRDMTPLLDPDRPTGLQYYPLPGIGERFPIYDPAMVPVLEPLPGDSVTFFQGMLEGIARIEAQGYRLLTKLGAPELKTVFSTGGGSHNAPWERIRARVLGVPLKPARSPHAAYGAALIAAGLHLPALAA